MDQYSHNLILPLAYIRASSKYLSYEDSISFPFNSRTNVIMPSCLSPYSRFFPIIMNKCFFKPVIGCVPGNHVQGFTYRPSTKTNPICQSVTRHFSIQIAEKYSRRLISGGIDSRTYV